MAVAFPFDRVAFNMSKQPKVSVIIPFYNRKKHIKDCLTSVRQSTLRNIEIIFLDDGSTDDTYDFLYKIASHDRRIKVIKAEHKGPYESRWVGLRAAKGEFIHFMDSDDTIDAEAYEECYSVCKDEKLDYLVFRCNPFIDENHNETEAETSQSFATHYTLSDNCCDKTTSGMELMRMLMTNKCFFVGLPMRMIRRSIIEEEDFALCRAFYHADNFYSVHWLSRAKRAMAINRKFYNRRVHRNSITMNKGVEERHVKSILQVIVAFLHSFTDGADYGGLAGGYLMRLARGLNRHTTHMSPAEISVICEDALSTESPELGYFVKFLFFPLLNKLAKAF